VLGGSKGGKSLPGVKSKPGPFLHGRDLGGWFGFTGPRLFAGVKKETHRNGNFSGSLAARAPDVSSALLTHPRIWCIK